MVIEIDNISKSFGTFVAVRDVSLSVGRGEFFGLLGPNGAGKSTLIAMILGLLPPDSGGSLRLFGEPVRGAGIRGLRARVGVVGEAPQLRDERSAVEYLAFFARLYGLDRPVDRAYERLADVGLVDAATRRIRAFSRGMKQRLSLARALLHDPELLILDEPTSGLDPQGVHEVRELLEARHRAGVAVLLSSHLLSEVERSCERVAVIHRGRIRALGSTEDVAQGDLEKSFLRLTAVQAGRDAEGAEDGPGGKT